MRGIARRLTLVTAHPQAGQSIELDWAQLPAPDATLAICMGRATAVAQQLTVARRGADTPVLVVVNASLPEERIIRGRFSSLAFLVDAISATDLVVLIVGEAMDGNVLASA